MDIDAFLMALHRFIARRGKPFEILSYRGTNLGGGAADLQNNFANLEVPLQEQLAINSLNFSYTICNINYCSFPYCHFLRNNLPFRFLLLLYVMVPLRILLLLPIYLI